MYLIAFSRTESFSSSHSFFAVRTNRRTRLLLLCEQVLFSVKSNLLMFHIAAFSTLMMPMFAHHLVTVERCIKHKSFLRSQVINECFEVRIMKQSIPILHSTYLYIHGRDGFSSVLFVTPVKHCTAYSFACSGHRIVSKVRYRIY